MNAIILCGGRSVRMGFDKSFLNIDGKPLIKRQIDILAKKFNKIIIVTNTPQKYVSLNNVDIVCDIIPYKGPLGGIYSGLMNSDSEYNFVIACDIPKINLELIDYMDKLKSNYDAVIPHLFSKYQPLFAIYSRKCIPKMRYMLNKNNLRLTDIINELRVNVINEDKLKKFDKIESLFLNLNTKDDLKYLSSIVT